MGYTTTVSHKGREGPAEGRQGPTTKFSFRVEELVIERLLYAAPKESIQLISRITNIQVALFFFDMTLQIRY
jgi:hypothetical protein